MKLFNGNRKRLLAALTAALLTITAFTGCNATDAGFAALCMEAANLKSFEVSGDFEMEVNPYAIYYYDDDENQAIKLRLSFSGEAEWSDYDDVYFDLNVRYGFNSKDMPFSANIRLYNNVCYMPVKDYIDLYIEMSRLSGTSDKMCESFKAAFLKEMGEYDYIIVEDIPEMYQEAIFSETVMEMFSGLNTGMTGAVPGGYSLEITTEKAVDFYERFINYVSENRDAIYKGALKLAEELQKFDEYGIMEDLEDREAFDEFIDDMVHYASPSDWDKEYVKLLFRGSYLKTRVTKHGKSYAQDLDMNLCFRGEQLMSAKGNVTVTVKDDIKQEAASTINPILIEDLGDQMNRIERRINYVTKAVIKWGNYSYRYYYDDDRNMRNVYVDIERVEGGDWHFAECIDDFGTIYLPMRQICEWFGEEVAWDGAAKKAYVVRGDEKIEMTGRLENSTTFVKVRDFEKLGYKVEYEYDSEDYYEHRVTISGGRNGV